MRNKIKITSRGNVWVECPFFSLESISEASKRFHFYVPIINLFGFSLSILVKGKMEKMEQK